MKTLSLWYHDGKLIELKGNDPYGKEWHHIAYAIFNEKKLGLPKGTVEEWCKENNCRISHLYNDYEDFGDRFLEFLFKKGYVRVYFANGRTNIMFLSKNKKSVNACMDLMYLYGEKLKKIGTEKFVFAQADDFLDIPFHSNNINDCITYLANL